VRKGPRASLTMELLTLLQLLTSYRDCPVILHDYRFYSLYLAKEIHEHLQLNTYNFANEMGSKVKGRLPSIDNQNFCIVLLTKLNQVTD